MHGLEKKGVLEKYINILSVFSSGQVQETVHGVTTEECQAALQNHNWNVQKAIQYLKVEQLFCLGLKTRLECQKVLEMFDWNLEQASSHMLDPYNAFRLKR
nr:PREDICTED: activated CDC42 kinase 1 [Anolis carolinensis]|eukprot:XP_008118228.1 PREDICTED: activated CDC42 kinase 1 [Anolis carolinensis]